MNDPLDIKLTVKDAQEMDAGMLVSMYEKLRADRNDVRAQRAQDARTLRRSERYGTQLKKVVRELEGKLAVRDTAIAEVGLRMIQCGMAQHMMSTFVNDPDPDDGADTVEEE